MKHFLSVSKKLVAVCLAVLLAVVTVPALSVSATSTPVDANIILDGNGGKTSEGNSSITISATDFISGADDYNEIFTRDGYTFVGWYGDVSGTGSAKTKNDAKSLTGNTRWYAKWSANYAYTVYFRKLSTSEKNFNNNLSYNKNSGSQILTTASYEKAELGFDLPSDAWLQENNKITVNTITSIKGWYYVGADQKLHKASQVSAEHFNSKEAVYVYVIISKDYSISYDLNGGKFDTNDALYNVKYAGIYENGVTLCTPAKTGYSPAGWDVYSGAKKLVSGTDYTIVGSTFTLNTLQENGVTLKAKWTEKKTVIYENTELFTAAGLAKLTQYFVKSGTETTINKSELPATFGAADIKEGYSFVGWYNSSKLDTEVGSTITSGETIYAKFSYQVVLNTTIADSLDTVLAAAKTAGKIKDFSEASGVYTITLYADDELEIPEIEKVGYTFDGFYQYKVNELGVEYTVSGKKVVDHIYEAEDIIDAPVYNSAASQNFVLLAKWSPVSYTINYTLNGGKVAEENPTTITYGDTDNNAVALYKSHVAGYKSTSDATWYIKGTEIVISKPQDIIDYLVTKNVWDTTTSVELVAVFPVAMEPETYHVYYLYDTVNANGYQSNLEFYSKQGWVYYEVDVDGNEIEKIGDKSDWEDLYKYDLESKFYVQFNDADLTAAIGKWYETIGKVETITTTEFVQLPITANTTTIHTTDLGASYENVVAGTLYAHRVSDGLWVQITVDPTNGLNNVTETQVYDAIEFKYDNYYSIYSGTSYLESAGGSEVTVGPIAIDADNTGAGYTYTINDVCFTYDGVDRGYLYNYPSVYKQDDIKESTVKARRVSDNRWVSVLLTDKLYKETPIYDAVRYNYTVTTYALDLDGSENELYNINSHKAASTDHDVVNAALNVNFTAVTAREAFLKEGTTTVWYGVDSALDAAVTVDQTYTVPTRKDLSQDFAKIAVKDANGNYRYYVRQLETVYYVGYKGEVVNGYTKFDLNTVEGQEAVGKLVFGSSFSVVDDLTANGKYMPSYSITSEYKIADDFSSLNIADGSIRFTGWVDRNGNQVTGKVGKANLPETESIDIATGANYDGNENVLFLYGTWARADLYSIKYELNGAELETGVSPVNYYVKNVATDPLKLMVASQVDNHFEAFDGDVVAKVGYTYDKLYKAADKTAGQFSIANDLSNSGNTTVYVGWTPIEETVNYYQVLNINGNDQTPFGAQSTKAPTKVTIEKSIDLTKYAAPTKAGYTFVGWCVGAVGKDYLATEVKYDGNAAKNVFAYFEANTYTITYNLNGGEQNPSHQYVLSYDVTDSTLTLYTPVKTGYTFECWKNVNTNELISGDSYTLDVAEGDIELLAIWSKNATAKTITLNNIDTNLFNAVTTSINVTDKAVAFPELVLKQNDYANYVTFKGWYNYPTATAAAAQKATMTRVYTTADVKFATGSNNANVYAVFEYSKFSIGYELNGGSIVDTSAYPYQLSYYTTSLNYGDNSSAVFPQVKKAGYNFAGWYAEKELVTAVSTLTNVTKNVTLYAKWTAKTPISISYDCAGGYYVAGSVDAIGNQLFPSTNAYKGAAVVVNGEPTKAGYEFVGWSLNGKLLAENTIPAGLTGIDEVELVAVWKANTYTVVFKNYVEATKKYEEFEQELTYDQIAKLAKVESMKFTAPEGKVFVGWTVEEGKLPTYANNQAVKNLSASADVELYAVFAANAYIISYVNTDDCEEVVVNNNPVVLYKESGSYHLQAPTMENHVFAGFYDAPVGGSQVTDINPAQGSKVLYMRWTVKTYNVKYIIDDTIQYKGTISSTHTSFNYHDGLASLPQLTLVGYTFAGWYDAEGNQVKSIAKHTSHDVVLTAKWSLLTNTQLFVGRSYRTFLRTTLADDKAALTSDPVGTAYWVDELDRGIQTGASLILNFFLSDEYQAVYKGILDPEHRYMDFVARLYTAMMGRAWNDTNNYDEVGYRYWINQMLNGQKAEDVIKNFARSEEFKGICAEYNIKNIIEK